MLEQVSHSTYVVCDLTYEDDKDMVIKVSRFQNICGTISRTLRRKACKERRSGFIRLWLRPRYFMVRNAWVTKHKDLRTLETAEMKFLRAAQECSGFYRVRNDDIWAVLDIELVTTAHSY